MASTLTYGTIEGRFLVGITDGVDVDLLPDVVPVSGTIDFVPMIPYSPIVDDSDPYVLFRSPIRGYLDKEGYLCTRRNDGQMVRGLTLLSTDAGVVTDWTYTVQYKLEYNRGVKLELEVDNVYVPTNSVQNLSTIVKVPSSTGVGVSQLEAALQQIQNAVNEAQQQALAASDAATAAQIAAEDALAAANSMVTANDTVVDGIVTDEVSATRTTLDGLYLTSDLDVVIPSIKIPVATDIEGGRVTLTQISDLANVAADERFSEIYSITDSPVYIYVDQLTGNDTTADGSTSLKFKTVQAAVDTLPPLINQTHVFKGNGVFHEDVVIKNVSGAGIWFQNTGGAPVDITQPTNFQVRSLSFMDSVSRVYLEGVDFIDTQNFGPDATAHIRGARTNYISITKCRFANDNRELGYKAIDFDQAYGTISESYFNAQKVNLISQNQAGVKVYGNNVQGPIKSGTGIWVNGGTVQKVGTLDWVANGSVVPYLRSQGGQVHFDGWENYSPNVTGYGTMVLDGVVVDEAKYIIIGNTCRFSMRATFGVSGTSGAPTNIVQVTLPVPSKSGLNIPLGAAGVRDPSFGPGFQLRAGKNAVWVYRNDGMSYTVGINRQVQLEGTYEID